MTAQRTQEAWRAEEEDEEEWMVFTVQNLKDDDRGVLVASKKSRMSHNVEQKVQQQ